jgi:RND family efflux transporter MFP subunit
VPARRRVAVLLLGLSGAAGGDPGSILVTAESAVREIGLTGFTRARAELSLVAEIPGRVEEVFHQIGEAVGPDGVFARIDDTFLRLEQREVAVEQERLREQIAYDEREVERYRELARQSNASQSQLDTLEQALRNNRHALRALEVKQEMLAERIERTRVRAPPGWLVTARLVEPGQWVKDGDPLGTAADFSTLLVPFALTPEQHAALPAGGGIALALPDLGRTVAAEIYRLNPGFDPDTRKIAIELAVIGEVSPRRGGLRALLPLALPERSGAVMLPLEALEESYEEHWLTREDGSRVRVTLLGISGDGRRARVASPEVRPGERFRTTGTED